MPSLSLTPSLSIFGIGMSKNVSGGMLNACLPPHSGQERGSIGVWGPEQRLDRALGPQTPVYPNQTFTPTLIGGRHAMKSNLGVSCNLFCADPNPKA